MVFSVPSTDFLSSSTWIIDSGASSHISHDLKYFSSFTLTSNKFVVVPNNTKISVSGIGHITLSPSLILKNVLYIPSFHVNLISVSCLLNTSCYSLSFTNADFLIQDKSQQRVIGKGSLAHGLYVLHNEPLSLCNVLNSAITNKCNSVQNNVAKLWHSRLGHLSDNVLKIVSNKIPFMFSSKSHSHNCSICPMAKFHKLPFVSHNNHS